ncbi:DUF4852 domain-containing protein [Porphyromonadaceae bacterium W3.11]|nr:DUF4852 domain-containing protein [Porphyromonadaceae bacterium W3.11]
MNKHFLYLLLFISLLWSGNNIYAQNSYQTLDGTTWSVGDTIRIGYNQYGEYRSLYTLYESPDFTSLNPVKSDDLVLMEGTIIDIKPHNENITYSSSESNILIISLPSEEYPKIYIDIDEAVVNHEVVLRFSDNPTSKVAIDLTDDLIWAYCIRVNKIEITDDLVMSYIKMTKDETLVDELSSNKFKFEREKETYRKELQMLADHFDFSKIYRVKLNATFGEYDFKKQGYPCEYYVYPTSRWYYGLDEWQVIGINKNYNLFVGNDYERTSFLLFPPGKAEEYELTLQKLNDKYIGYINQIYASIYVKLIDTPVAFPPFKREAPKNSDAEIFERMAIKREEEDRELSKPYTLNGKVISIDFFDHPSHEYNYIHSLYLQ